MKKYLYFLALAFVMSFIFQKANAQWAPPDTITFENPTSKIIIDTGVNNLWQIGSPHKIYFDSAFSGNKAILTDTLNYYPPNNTSSFRFVIRQPYTQTCQTCMYFWQKYDMDTVGDKGIIEASYDGGNSWLLLKDTANILPWGSYISWQMDYTLINGNLSSHKLILSGKSNGWIQSSICWQWYFAVKTDTIISMPDSLMIRFTFSSDSIVKNKEGWMIDNIVTTEYLPQNCTGIEEKSFNRQISANPNPFSSSTIISTGKMLENAGLILYNDCGQKIKQIGNINGNSFLLQRGNLPAGLYFLRLTENDKTVAYGKLMITD